MNRPAKNGRSTTKDPRSGYALLMIFCMAAVVSMMLYSQMPRVAFEAQRDKEELLMDRGKEFSRAVSLYVRKLRKFPPTMEALENTNGIRFLRRKYKDPMTGKDEWRIIHVGPNGVFTDSLVYGKKDKTTGEKQNFITELQQIGGPTATADTGVNLAMRKRASENPGAPGTGEAAINDPNAPNATQNAITNSNPAQNPNPAQGQMQVLPDGRIVPVQIQNGTLTTPTTLAGSFGPQANVPPGTPLPPGIGAQQPLNPSMPAQAQVPFGQTGPGGQAPAGAGAASDLIRNLLTTPRPGGAFGTPAAQGGSPAAGQTIGGGIAGVASTLEREGIKIFNEKTAYNEWEFVYDMSKDTAMSGGAQRTTAQPGQSNQPGQTAGPVPSPSGSSTVK